MNIGRAMIELWAGRIPACNALAPVPPLSTCTLPSPSPSPSPAPSPPKRSPPPPSPSPKPSPPSPSPPSPSVQPLRAGVCKIDTTLATFCTLAKCNAVAGCLAGGCTGTNLLRVPNSVTKPTYTTCGTCTAQVLVAGKATSLFCGTTGCTATGCKSCECTLPLLLLPRGARARQAAPARCGRGGRAAGAVLQAHTPHALGADPGLRLPPAAQALPAATRPRSRPRCPTAPRPPAPPSTQPAWPAVATPSLVPSARPAPRQHAQPAVRASPWRASALEAHANHALAPGSPRAAQILCTPPAPPPPQPPTHQTLLARRAGRPAFSRSTFQ